MCSMSTIIDWGHGFDTIAHVPYHIEFVSDGLVCVYIIHVHQSKPV